MKPHFTARTFHHVNGGFFAILFANGLQFASTLPQSERNEAALDGAYLVWMAVRSTLMWENVN